jgi:phage/plasmid-associated DNA primase
VLNYLVQGAHRWFIDWKDSHRYADRANTGLQLPLDVEQFKELYVEAMDHIGRFIAECVLVEADAKVRGADVHNTFKRWRGRGETSNRNRLYARLKTLKGVSYDSKTGMFTGIRLQIPAWSELGTRAHDVNVVENGNF